LRRDRPVEGAVGSLRFNPVEQSLELELVEQRQASPKARLRKTSGVGTMEGDLHADCSARSASGADTVESRHLQVEDGHLRPVPRAPELDGLDSRLSLDH
jgi:hypothetical protein